MNAEEFFRHDTGLELVDIHDFSSKQIFELMEEYASKKVEERFFKYPDNKPKQGHYLVRTPKSFPKNCKWVVAEFDQDSNMFYDEYDEPLEDVTHWAEIPSFKQKEQ